MERWIRMVKTLPLPAPSWEVGLRPILVPWDKSGQCL